MRYLIALLLLTGCDFGEKERQRRVAAAQKEMENDPKFRKEMEEFNSKLQAIAATPLYVDAIALWHDYDANEVAADLKYKDKHLEVRGVVKSVDKDFRGHISIHLKGPKPIGGARARLAETEAGKAARIAKGQTVNMLCIGAGRMLIDPVLNDCTIE